MHDVPNIVVTHCGFFQWQLLFIGLCGGVSLGIQIALLVKPNREVKPGGEPRGDNRLNDEEP